MVSALLCLAAVPCCVLLVSRLPLPVIAALGIGHMLCSSNRRKTAQTAHEQWANSDARAADRWW
jgi:hypothetical protein